MNEVKFTMLHQGLNSAAKKVYEAVPGLDAWSLGQIGGELRRQGVTLDHRVIEGCVGALVAAGLVVAPDRHTFRRVPVRKKAEAVPPLKLVPKVNQPMPVPEKQISKPIDPISLLTDLAHQARAWLTTSMRPHLRSVNNLNLLQRKSIS